MTEDIIVGRKLFDGKDEGEILSKLEAAFSLGCTDEEACIEADISTSALYRYEEENPEFRQRKKLLKSKLITKARKSVAKGIEENPKLAWDYLKRKKPGEFGLETKGPMLKDFFSDATRND